MINHPRVKPPAPRDERKTPAPPPWQPRFGLGTMMLVMLVCGVMSSAGYYLVRGNMTRGGEGGSRLQLVFILITLASPLLLAAGISMALQITRTLSRRRPQNKKQSDDDGAK